MPEHSFGLLILPLEENDGTVCFNRPVQIHGLTFADGMIRRCLDRDGKDILCESRADAHGNLIPGHAFFILPDTAVRESDVNHKKLK